jgi:uncharacterized protein YkwD
MNITRLRLRQGMQAAALGALVVVAGASSACERSASPAPRVPLTEPAKPTASDGTAQLVSGWPDVTRSPWTPSEMSAREAALAEACGTPDAALARVAARLLARRDRDRDPAEAERVVSLLRSNGEPHVRPRLVSAEWGVGARNDDAIRTRLSVARRATTRCGVALARADEKAGESREVFVAVSVDALADLAALPVRARTGEWLAFDASIHVPAKSAKLVVLGPRGLPRTVPTALDPASGRVHARFALDHPGAFTVQLLGDLAGGPQPLLEARIFADVPPTNDDENGTPAPGEDADPGQEGVAGQLAQMTAALRRAEGMSALARDDRLDALAREHAAKMLDAGTIAHDVGEGDLVERLSSAGLSASVVGENVARARSAALVHRAFYASPSHRMNLLGAKYTHLGVGVALDGQGVLYACEVFATLP